jgi:predicted MFS family arabinose efflux permease
MPTPNPDPNGGSASPSVDPGYARYALGILLAVYVVNFVDRQILSILLQPIKEEFELNDTQLGLLGGVAFAIFYATLGIPIGRFADRWSRKGVIAISIGIWSAMTALCGLATGFWSLLVARIGVGVGEAGGSPPAHSLIAEYFPPERLGTALSIFSLGVPIGILIGFLAGGWMNELLGWRRAFLIVGLPGVLLSAVVALTLREPARTGPPIPQPPLGEVFRYLFGLSSFRHASFGSALYAFVGYSVVTWAPAFLIRSHGMTSGPIGTWLALIIGIGGIVGTMAGGRLADSYGLRDFRAYVLVPTFAMLAAFPFAFVIYLHDSTTTILITLAFPVIFGAMYQGPIFSVVQSLSPVAMRSTAAAVLLFVINIIGMGLGPFATGVISDQLAGQFGDDSLRYALLIVSGAYVWAAFHFWMASRTIREDLAGVPNDA